MCSRDLEGSFPEWLIGDEYHYKEHIFRISMTEQFKLLM